MKKQLILFFVSYVLVSAAQSPNWSVDASNYQYSMTFTAFLNVNGTTLSSTEDKVVALVNGEVRGVANVTYVASADKYLVYLSVFANVSDESISFLIYNSATQTVYEVVTTQDFVIDGNAGGIFQSYSIASPPLNDKAVLNSFGFSGITPVSSTINNDKIDIVLPSNTNLTNLKAEFSVSDDASFFVDGTKQISGVSVNDFTSTLEYKILSENEVNLVTYQVHVTLGNQTINPPNIILKSDANGIVKEAPILINMETNVGILNLKKEDVLLENAVVASIVKVDELQYTLQIVPIQQGYFSIEIAENSIFNLQNDGNLASNKLMFTYDLVNPYLLSVKRENPINEITDTDTLVFSVIFSEAVENVFSTDFKSVENATFTVEKENNAKYIVTVKNIESYFGAVNLNIKATNNIQDKAGNLLRNSLINVFEN